LRSFFCSRSSSRFGALICPTFAVPALPFNIASRCPVLSIPSGLSRDGVPTGLSVVGKTYDDVTVFRVAAAHEERFAWLDAPERRPAI